MFWNALFWISDVFWWDLIREGHGVPLIKLGMES